MQLLRDESIEPSDDTLAELLAEIYPTYAHFISSITDEPLCLDPQWKYYKDGKSWLCRIMYKKKTISWMSVWEGYFKVTTYLSKKNLQEIDRLQIDSKLIAEFSETGLTRKYPYFMVNISSADQLSDVVTIMAFKKKIS
jgi:hypothetical protein